jgi:sterol desaturase/sphingolipid hydroxylase (fatty acid hydroxylase superfamily)
MEDPVFGLYHQIALALFAGFVLAELLLPGRAFPALRLWRARAALSTLAYFAVATFAPLVWDGTLGAYRLFDATTLPFWAQVLGGFLALELGVYAWHRTMHNVNPLWRWFHQMHHSAERIDVWGAFYFSPLDMLGFAFLGSLMLVLGFGLSGEAALVVNVAVTFLAMFQHANIRTPHWLGYLIVRPESHAAHHERGVHAFNYCDLPLWDMVFGTFKNPRAFEGRAGFWDGASARVGPMLLGRDVA